MPPVVITTFALLMQAGFALLTSGLVRKKNVAHLVMLNLAAFVFAMLAYYAIGYGVLSGPGGFFLRSVSEPPASMLSSLVFMLVTAYVVIGAICERIRFWGFVMYEAFVGALLFPIFCGLAWYGWLGHLGARPFGVGYIDVAGSTVVHATGGFSAMALAMILGPRIGKYDVDGRPRPFPAHNIAFVVAGTLMLVSGWMGLAAGGGPVTSGVSVQIVVINLMMAAAAGGAAAMVFWQYSYGKPDISMACNGVLAGLVAISAGCTVVGPNSAIAIGALAGVLVCGGVLFNERTLKIDDPCGSIAVHGYCGWLGAVCVGIFAPAVSRLWVQLIGATLCAVYAYGSTFLVFSVANRVRPLRVDAEVEIEGLDLHEFGMLAYPEDEGLG